MSNRLLLAAAEVATVSLSPEYLPTTCKQSYLIGIGVVFRLGTNVTLNTPPLVEACRGIEFVDENDLPAIH